MFTHGSLFTGIGGFDLAAEWCGWSNTFQVEKDEWCRNNLKINFPYAEQYDDVCTFDGSKYTNRVDVISGGFPCQPFSLAGEQKGTNDERYLWGEMFRVISKVRPTYVVAENVYGAIAYENGLVLKEVKANLESIGFEVAPFLAIPACAKNYDHRRERLWIIAHNDSFRLEKINARMESGDTCSKRHKKEEVGRNNRINLNPKTCGNMVEEWGYETGLETEPFFLRNVHGVSKKLDTHRVKALGNSIVPEIAFELFQNIQRTHDILFSNCG